jgi:phosphohistidine phosphatase SixA
MGTSLPRAGALRSPGTVPVVLHLVRHAKAGKRGAWDGPDAERPLSRSGQRQADGIAKRLSDAPPDARLVASPAMRCRQTLEPLAQLLGRRVEVDDRLAEGTPFAEVLELLAELPDGSALCSHGDVIPEVLDALVRRGLEVEGKPDWRKGATWELERDGEGRFTRARAVAPSEG